MVFSTYVEVILHSHHYFYKHFSILHVCGGDPLYFLTCESIKKYSPRMWRWSWSRTTLGLTLCVFSTYVEVILIVLLPSMLCKSILHVCGGDPNQYCPFAVERVYSPRMWRWSSNTLLWEGSLVVFSTYVEVILPYHVPNIFHCGILHVCGGDPFIHDDQDLSGQYSPRMWRWSYSYKGSKNIVIVFSTYVEVILWCSEWEIWECCILHTCWECYCPWAHR